MPGTSGCTLEDSIAPGADQFGCSAEAIEGGRDCRGADTDSCGIVGCGSNIPDESFDSSRKRDVCSLAVAKESSDEKDGTSTQVTSA